MRLGRPRLQDVQNPERLRAILEALIEQVNRSSSIHVGPGLQAQQTPGGIGISLAPKRPERRSVGGEAEDCSGGDLQTIGCTMGTQDSDTWAVGGETPKQVAIEVFTDISWDEVGGQIVGRMRKLTFDKCGNLKSIGAESALVTLITTESCTP